MLLEHQWDGRILHKPYLVETLSSLRFVSGKPVMLATRDENDEEQIYVCENQDVVILTRDQYNKNFGVVIA